MAIQYTPQYSLLATVTNAGIFRVQVTSNSDSMLATVTNAGIFLVQITSLPQFAVGSIVSVSGLTSAIVSIGAGSIVSVSGLTSASVTATNAGIFAVQVTSLPSFAIGSIVSISGLTSAIVSISNLPISVLATVTNAGIFAVSSLPALNITSLPNLAIGTVISVSGLTSATVSISNLPLQISGTTIAITSLPPLGAATVSISPISLLCTVTAEGIFRITSLPDLGLNSSIKITSLPAFAVGAITSISNNAIIQIGANANNWSFTSTYTAAQTNVVLKSEPSSTTAYYITDVIFSNCTTQGNISLIESRPNATIKVKIADLFFAPNGGAIINLRIPIVLDTNSALCMTSKSVTAHSVTVIGYIT